MPRGKGSQRTPAQKRADLAFIGDLLAQGYGSRDILERLALVRNYKLKLRTIQQDIVDLRHEWQKTSTANFAEHVARELSLIETVQAKALDGWERSKRKKKRTILQSRTGDKSKRPRIVLVEETSDGAAEFLLIMLKCSERRSKLLGLDRRKILSSPQQPVAHNPEQKVEIRITGWTNTDLTSPTAELP